MKNFRKLIATLLFTAISLSANATIFTNSSAFMAATTGAVITDFEENSSGGFTHYTTTYAGTGFTVNATSIFTVDPDFDPLYDWGTGDVLDLEFGLTTITLDPMIRAFGFYFGNPALAFGSGIVTINGVDYNLLGQPDFNFFGIISDSPIAPITIDWNGGLGIIDNVTVASAVPTPGTLALLGLGLAVFGFSHKRKVTESN